MRPDRPTNCSAKKDFVRKCKHGMKRLWKHQGDSAPLWSIVELDTGRPKKWKHSVWKSQKKSHLTSFTHQRKIRSFTLSNLRMANAWFLLVNKHICNLFITKSQNLCFYFYCWLKWDIFGDEKNEWFRAKIFLISNGKLNDWQEDWIFMIGI